MRDPSFTSQDSSSTSSTCSKLNQPVSQAHTRHTAAALSDRVSHCVNYMGPSLPSLLWRFGIQSGFLSRAVTHRSIWVQAASQGLSTTCKAPVDLPQQRSGGLPAAGVALSGLQLTAKRDASSSSSATSTLVGQTSTPLLSFFGSQHHPLSFTSSLSGHQRASLPQHQHQHQHQRHMANLSRQRIFKSAAINEVPFGNNTDLKFGRYGIRATTGRRVAANTIEAVRRWVNRMPADVVDESMHHACMHASSLARGEQ